MPFLLRVDRKPAALLEGRGDLRCDALMAMQSRLFVSLLAQFREKVDA